ncbi:hypothetical protein CUMW_033440 [Citrus unshiu]|nr:hypothetical protein CUMW_033440 [Citrus unshiu]
MNRVWVNPFNKDSIEIGGGDRRTANASGKRGIFAPTQVSNSNGTAWGERGGFFSDSLSVHAGSLLDNREWLLPPKHLIAIAYKQLAQVVKEKWSPICGGISFD